MRWSIMQHSSEFKWSGFNIDVFWFVIDCHAYCIHGTGNKITIWAYSNVLVCAIVLVLLVWFDARHLCWFLFLNMWSAHTVRNDTCEITVYKIGVATDMCHAIWIFEHSRRCLNSKLCQFYQFLPCTGDCLNII